MENIFWTAYSNLERHIAIEKVKILISKYGDVVDFKLFSDISITLTIEIQELKMKQLYCDLQSILSINKVENINTDSKKERTIYLNITFSKSTGSLTINIPSVPG